MIQEGDIVLFRFPQKNQTEGKPRPALVIRATRLAVVASDILQGTIGSLTGGRLDRIRGSIARWISGADSASVPE